MTTKEDKAQFELFLTGWDVERRDRKTKAKEDLYLLLDQNPNITGIDVAFDGCGDEGHIEGITYLGETDDAIASNQELDDAVEEYVCWTLPSGWEINEGSFGTIHIDVKARSADCTFSYRYCTSKDASFKEE